MSEETVKIVKVVVNKMPTRCGECPFVANEFKGIYVGYDPVCVALRNKYGVNAELCDDVKDIAFRRHDCPLIAEKQETEL